VSKSFSFLLLFLFSVLLVLFYEQVLLFFLFFFVCFLLNFVADGGPMTVLRLKVLG